MKTTVILRKSGEMFTLVDGKIKSSHEDLYSLAESLYGAYEDMAPDEVKNCNEYPLSAKEWVELNSNLVEYFHCEEEAKNWLRAMKP